MLAQLPRWSPAGRRLMGVTSMCVRHVFRWPRSPQPGPFPPPPPRPWFLFGGFAGTTGLSDFPYPSISGVPPQRSLNGPPGDHPGGRARNLPVLAHGDSAHARGLRPRGVRQQLAITLQAMLPSASVNSVGTPVKGISRLNNPACTYPLSTLRRRPHERRRMTRGHRGSLLLRRRALPSPSPCRFIPAL